MVDLLLSFAHFSGIYAFMHSAWGWPVIESLHFTGMCLLIGAVGLFDFRMLGIAKGIPITALHKLIPFGIAGFAMNAGSGAMFLVSAPDQYLYNPAFQVKILMIWLAGLNMLLFYRTTFAEVRLTSADGIPMARARLMGGISLACWTVAIVCGRLITYYRPPYHWCLWC
ncbi:MAG: hypothetical protein KJN90_04590 [Gammaproteobacteria bacterium]|nr:hypothetical protein [Gammaproteobacteria bacterium]